MLTLRPTVALVFVAILIGDVDPSFADATETPGQRVASVRKASKEIGSIEILKTPDHMVRLLSGQNLCEEGLVAGQWVGIGRRLKGHAGAADPVINLPAFQIEVLDSPEAKTP